MLCRAIITNKNLKLFKVKSDDRCTFCLEDTETLEHLFVNCKMVKRFWNEVRKELKTNRIWEARDIMFNTIENNPKLLSNFIVLLGKVFIYTKKCQAEKLNFEIFKRWTLNIKEIENIIAVKKGKTSQHELKWLSTW